MDPLTTPSGCKIKDAQSWQMYRQDILNRIQQVMGDLPDMSSSVVYRVINETQQDGILRQKIVYTAAKNDYMPAYILRPLNIADKRPAILCLHQTTIYGKDEVVGLAGRDDLHYGIELAKRGYVVIAPDYMGFGENTSNPYQQGYASASMKGVLDNMRAIDVLCTLPCVDTEKIGCIGHSLGGYNSLFVTAFDQRIKAVVVSCGFTSFHFYNNGSIETWGSRHHMPLVISKYKSRAENMPFDFPDVIAAIAPRPIFVNAPLHDETFDVTGVKATLDSARHVYKLLKAPRNVTAIYPNCDHGFPDQARLLAYDFLDKALGFNAD